MACNLPAAGLRRPLLRLCAGLACAGLLHAGLACAAEWSYEPSIDLRGEYNDNILLTPSSHEAVWGLTASPALKLRGRSETLDVSGLFRFDFHRYSGDSALDTDDQTLDVRASLLDELDSYGLAAAYVRDSTLASELTDTGFATGRQQRSKLVLAPNWKRRLNERDTLGVEYQFNDVRYDEEAGSQLVDYRSHAGTIGLTRLLSEREQGSAHLSYTTYETRPDQRESDQLGLRLGYARAFSETLRGEFSLGYLWTDASQQANTLVCTGPIVAGVCTGNLVSTLSKQTLSYHTWVAELGLSRELETGSLSFRLGRDILPSGVGYLTKRDRLLLSWQQSLTPTLTGRLTASLYRSRFQERNAAQNDSDYYRLEPGLNWRLTPRWALDAIYWYARQTYQSNSQEASVNGVYLTLSYDWPKVSRSR